MEKIYFNPGDVVTLKQEIPNKPTMIVVKKVSANFMKDETKDTLLGIKCRWFTNTGLMQEANFNTKDLIKL